MPLIACTTLSSLTLSMDCNFEDGASTGEERGEVGRVTLRDYTEILGAHPDVFTRLANVRLKMVPAGLDMLDAFVRVAQDRSRDWLEVLALVSSMGRHETQWNREVWASLEDALCSFCAVCAVRDGGGGGGGVSHRTGEGRAEKGIGGEASEAGVKRGCAIGI